MNNDQKNLVKYWMYLVALLISGLYVSFSDIENKQAALLILLVPFSIVSLFQDFSYYKGYGQKGELIGSFIEKHPYLKLYLVFYCATVLPFMIYEIVTSGTDGPGDVLYFVSLFMLIGPIVVVSERERFISLGE